MSDLRFWARVDIATDGDGCWLWQGALTKAGYGSVKRDGRVQYAHRYAYEQTVGPIPTGLELDHLCHVRQCVNPAHLEPVTHQVNNARRDAFNRRTNCPQGHAMVGDNVLNDCGTRRCRTCVNDRARRRRQLQAAS